MEPVAFYKQLADDTRLSCLLLILAEQELCVCELTEALDLSQPKVSRHLAQLKKSGLLDDRRQGKWIFYSISKDLPHWAKLVLIETGQQNPEFIKDKLFKLNRMGSRPERVGACCYKESYS
ncbi:metalloregulator ArsR/SmtB family transcription factor [Aliikangiella sp. G2MR2-5]|uniref:metalloregulator ArsR/SmtB family transcription factor n=1 Tax=Aliikangiella sp. G2MR2-5 TaxID=2788943 RepID=UPI0018AA9512|nr:metalloregulator ArsR/SmtB family transcription factor [Aliikangiella sp. G2MR2-5]